MATYTKEQLQEATALYATKADALQAAYNGMYDVAIQGGTEYTTDPITPESVRDSVKATLEAAPQLFTVSINQQDSTKLIVSWA